MSTTRSITVPYVEVVGSPVITRDERGVKVARKFKCAWDDAIELTSQLLGGTSGGVTYLPQAFPGFVGVIVKSTVIEPFHTDVQADGDERTAKYDDATVTANYSNEQSQSSRSSDQLVSESFTFGKQAITLAGDFLYFDPGTTQTRRLAEAAQPIQLISLMTWNYTRHKMTAIPAAAKNLIGCVNDAAITGETTGLTFDAEELYYDSLEIARSIDLDGVETKDMTYHFQSKIAHNTPGGFTAGAWNLSLDPSDGLWKPYYLKDSSTPYKPFKPASFSALTR